MKQPATIPTKSATKDETIRILKNKINLLEELLMDGAGPIKAYPLPAKQKEKTAYIDQLTQINKFNPGVIEKAFLLVNSLHLEALGKTHLQSTIETMQELSDNHPHEYQYALRHIDIDHNFFFDIETGDSLDFTIVDEIADEDINFLLDLIPEQHNQPMVMALVNQAVKEYTALQVEEAIVYARRVAISL